MAQNQNQKPTRNSTDAKHVPSFEQMLGNLQNLPKGEMLKETIQELRDAFPQLLELVFLSETIRFARLSAMMKAGFSEEQAMRILETEIIAASGKNSPE